MKSVIATTASVLMLCTGVAMAQQQAIYEGHRDHLDTDDNGAVSQTEYQAFMRDAFNRLDGNNDGYLTQDDVSSVLSGNQFSGMDSNGDGRVSRQEFTTQVTKDFQSADNNGDGQL
jgi:Ca2+-binding EF-hand superfamily protein